MLKIDPKDDIFFTATMARVLESQGRLDDALTVYRILLDSRPSDASLKESVERLLGRASSRGGAGTGAQAGGGR